MIYLDQPIKTRERAQRVFDMSGPPFWSYINNSELLALRKYQFQMELMTYETSC